MAYEDLTLQCMDCGCDFEFTVSEQEFYEQKGLANRPKRCKPCRTAKKNASRGGYPKKMYDVVCSQCGRDAQVPFKPSDDRPVLCKECYSSSF
ncbi:MAG: zinc-ribbon domain containing protein [Candidatus Gastranaerophilales bacterium]|nr:zinc-ribbon domain containing protein [Candidatus Gastranaerophilales bacterium]